MSREAMELALEALENSRPINQNSVLPHNKHVAAITALREALAQPQQKPLTDWVSVDERLPEKGGYYLVTVDTDDGPHVDVLLFNDRRKYWEHEGEPTFCYSYLFSPTHWANRPEAAHGIKDAP